MERAGVFRLLYPFVRQGMGDIVFPADITSAFYWLLLCLSVQFIVAYPKRSLTEIWRQLTIPPVAGFFETLILNMWLIIHPFLKGGLKLPSISTEIFGAI